MKDFFCCMTVTMKRSIAKRFSIHDLIFYWIGLFKVEVLESACVVIIGGSLIYCFMSSCISQELERNARSIIGNIWSMTH